VTLGATAFLGRNEAMGANACFEQWTVRRFVLVVGAAIVANSPIVEPSAR
jgi:hypothetical protein